MRLSRYFLPISEGDAKEAEIVSHRLMLRAGMIRQEAAGSYAWLPLGVRVLHKICAIIREEQNRAGAIEVLMPTIQSADLWRESGRYDDYGKEMLRVRDRHDRDMLYGPTNEEVIIRDLSRLGALLQGSAAQSLSHPVDFPRRGKTPLRGDALARIPDEGRLHLRPRSGWRPAILTTGSSPPIAPFARFGLTADPDAGGNPVRSAATFPTSSSSSPRPAERSVSTATISRSRRRPRTSISATPRRCRRWSTNGTCSTPPHPTNTMRPHSSGSIPRSWISARGIEVGQVHTTSGPNTRLPWKQRQWTRRRGAFRAYGLVRPR